LANVRSAINIELGELANAYLALSQGYTISGQSGCCAATDGSQAIDTPRTVPPVLCTAPAQPPVVDLLPSQCAYRAPRPRSMPPFFPNPEFGWVFFAALAGLLGAAAYADTRRLVIPKKISLTILGLGVLFNVVRGAWLGAEGKPGWVFDGGALAGAADGLLFA